LCGIASDVEAGRPGIAKTNRPRSGSFASLLDQVLGDESALDALAFAYGELPPPARLAMMHAVVQDAAKPAQALTALLAVEEEPHLRKRLEALLLEHAGLEQSALSWGTPQQGGAALIHALRGSEPEILRITWNQSEIESIALESQADSSLKAVPTDPKGLVETLAPMIWRHIRSGGALPPGMERFAGFF